MKSKPVSKKRVRKVKAWLIYDHKKERGVTFVTLHKNHWHIDKALRKEIVALPCTITYTL